MSAKAIKTRATDTARGLGRDAQWYVIVAGVVADSLNRRYALGLTEQEIIAGAAGLLVAANRLKQWLNE